MLDEFRAVAETLSFQAPRIPVVSNLDGVLAGERMADPGYWVAQVRQTVRFAEGIAALEQGGVVTCLELGPGRVLSGLGSQITGDKIGYVPTSGRRDDSQARAFVAAVGRAFARGAEVDWEAFYAPLRPKRVDLPTYPFQHRRYWLTPEPTGTGEVASLGQVAGGHALAGALIPVPEGDALVLTGQVSLKSHPWLADHAIMGTALLPGTAFVDLALHAGVQAGCPALRELTLHAPLPITHEGTALHVSVAAPEEDGSRSLTIHSRAGDDVWTRHATGILTPETAPARPIGSWPPPEASPIDLDGFYDRLAEQGVAYGPAFRGVTKAWTASDGSVYAEVDVPGQDGDGFGIHPALLDAALHAIDLATPGTGAVELPFAWTDVTLHATGATKLLVHLTPGPHAVSIEAADEAGNPVVSIGSLALREVSADQLTRRPTSLYHLEWVPVLPAQPGGGHRWIAAGDGIPADPAENETFLVRVDGDLPQALALLQSWIAADRPQGARLAVVTGDTADPDIAAVWGLVKSAQAEHPGLFLLAEHDGPDTGLGAGLGDHLDAEPLLAAFAAGEQQIRVREGKVQAARLGRVPAALIPPADGWRVDSEDKGSLDRLTVVPAPEAAAPLTDGQVRIAVRAAGVNFRDVLNALGMYPGEAGPMGLEGAGVVTEVGPGVAGVAVGERVMGMFDGGAFGPLAVTDHRQLAPVPEGWSFAEAAAVPVAFLTAYYGLVDLADLRPGERVLIHAAAGGVGMAAVQIARHLGAEVYGTAGPAKWPATGLDEDHLASSRTLEFADRFPKMDVVLNSLAGDFTDASLGLLQPHGRFIEMGKTDLRPDTPGYTPFDLGEAGPVRIGEMLRHLLELFAEGRLHHHPRTCWDVRQAKDAFRHMQQARHIGKVVLTVPAPLDPDGTVLITGGTGGLGGAVARHLAGTHGVRRLLLTSRSGPDAPGAQKLLAELSELGAEAEIAAADAGDREALAGLVDGRELTAVVHCAGVLDDGVISALTPGRLDRVLRPKATAARHLHELTRDHDLRAFVLFSSLAGTAGSTGQGNYAAANAYLDAFARRHHAAGLPVRSLAWGPWAGGMLDGLAENELAMMAREGLVPLTVQDGLALLDAALARPEPVLVPAAFDVKALAARGDALPPLLRGLPPGRRTRRTAARRDQAGLADRLAALGEAERRTFVHDLVLGQVAVVLGHGSAEEVAADQTFEHLGVDSLTAVELRNGLSAATGRQLPSTLVFDHATPAALAEHLLGELAPDAPKSEQVLRELDRVAVLLAGLDADEETRSIVTDRLDGLLTRWRGERPAAAGTGAGIETASADELLALIDKGL
ncbi:SDR family NAD(P)-dependent oxidoreductase [Nonomuraea fuscirosea]|uniref:SDR family NAD(P)-dependent oxidoreductase n=1 Tax=Nonomuraea fuscirosea TaxID=1291556 RepID=UPI00341510D4